MEKTGYSIRKVDELGRIVIPIDLRRELKIKEKDELEVFKYGDGIFIKKYHVRKRCALCGEVKKLINIEQINSVCQDCIVKVKSVEV